VGTHDQMLEAARHAVVDAARVTRHVQQRLSAFRSMLKPDDSPVSVADFAAQAVIAHRLGEQLGMIVMVGEESAAELEAMLSAGDSAVPEQVLDAVRVVWPQATMEKVLTSIDVGADEPPAHGAPFWTLDPIDGTKGFLRGQQYAISLAWIEGGEVTIGALGCPNLPIDHARALDESDDVGSLYLTTIGNGVLESRCAASGSPRALRRPKHDPGRGVRITASVEKAHSSEGATSDVMRWMASHAPPGHGGIASPVRIDSQAKYAVVARGQADAYLRLPVRRSYEEKIWDHAAGALVAMEAGVRVTDMLGLPLDFSLGSTLARNRGIVCAPPEVHARLMEAISAIRGRAEAAGSA
jgi:HAL2 family 3'(2'),5'-bisphosphate nucleotidase